MMDTGRSPFTSPNTTFLGKISIGGAWNGANARWHQASNGLGTKCTTSTRAAAPPNAYPLSCVWLQRMLSVQINQDMRSI